MQRWLGFFLGTPQRFLTTVCGITLILGLFNPDKVERALYGLLQAISNAIAPFIEPVLTLAFMAIGIGLILRSVWRKGGGGK